MASTSSFATLPLANFNSTALLLSCRRIRVKNTSIPRGVVRYPTSREIRSVSCSSLKDGKVGEKDYSEELQVRTSTWNWKGYSIRYQCAGVSGPALVLVHGFGANSDHWRKNTSVLGKSHRVYSIDLIGYGYSDKPNPREFEGKAFYTFQTWAEQLNDFCVDVVKDKAFFICNSIGGVVGLEAATSKPEICRGIMLLNISLRMLHIKKQPFVARPFISSFQNLLR